MTREQLELLLRACAVVLNDRLHAEAPRHIVVIGSQAVLGQFPRAPQALLRSMEADVFPLEHPELADALDVAIGEGSRFHETYGFYAQGVGPRTAVLPRGWESRLVRVESAATAPAVGLCLEIHDLAISKYVAGRPKDLDYTRDLARHRLTDEATLRERLTRTELDPARRHLAEKRIEAHFRSG